MVLCNRCKMCEPVDPEVNWGYEAFCRAVDEYIEEPWKNKGCDFFVHLDCDNTTYGSDQA